MKPASRLFVSLSLLLSLWLCTNVSAQEGARNGTLAQIPEPLKAWTGWALHGAEEERCTHVNDVRVCLFPTALTLQMGKTSGTFTMRVTLEQPSAVALPGSTEHFPLDVKLDKKAIPVVDEGGTPYVRLAAGTHTISGSFQFRALPDSLQLPGNLALLKLSVDGAPVPFPKRDAGGLLWLKQSGDGAEEERLNLSVHRRLEDGVPVTLTTRLHVSAAGKAREIVLPNVLVAGTHPIELRTGLPAELTAEGALRLQIQAGEHDIELVAIRETGDAEFKAAKKSDLWPERELWVIKTDERIRHVEVQGPAQIDPARTDLAHDWHGLPTYVMPSEQTLKLETRRRGEPEPAPNQLHLARTLWLDLDGDGYTVLDHFTGTMNRGFRLDLTAAPLGHALDQGQDQLVTQYDKHSGVELRQKIVKLETEWRLPHGRNQLPAVGYNEDVESLRADLHLPPGFMLLGAEGVDHVPGTWIDGWDLFDFFFVLLVALAVGKLSGWYYGITALIALVLTHHEPDAPALAWVFLLAMSALVLALKQDRFSKLVRFGWGFALVCVLLVMLPFSVMQVRKALYPHLDHTQVHYFGSGAFMSRQAPPQEYSDVVMQAEPVAAPSPEEAPSMARESAKEEAANAGVLGTLTEAAGVGVATSPGGGGADRAIGSGSGYGRGAGKAVGDRNQALGYKTEVDPSAVVQTGPGLPSWAFRHFSLNWSGPVQKAQRITLWIVPPLFTRLWAIASVLFSLSLLLALVQTMRRADAPSAPNNPSGIKPSSGTWITMLTLLGFVAMWPASVFAQVSAPSPELLQQLRERLLEPPQCAPNCLTVSSLALRIDGSRLVLRAEVHAQATATYQVPGPLESWTPDTVLVDGKDALAAVRSGDGFLHVRLDEGVHQVELSGAIPRGQAFTLSLGTPPHQVTAEHKGYIVDGLRDDGRAEGSLSIRREVRSDDETQETSRGLSQWFEVRRELELGVRFRIRTTVTRLGPATDSTLLRLPLLAGESVNEAGLVSDGQGVVIELPRGERSKSFSSTMIPKPKLVLKANVNSDTNTRPYSEVWVIAPSVLYRPRFEGIAPIAHVSDAGTYQPEYRPFPDEQLTIYATRLAGSEGSSVTTDNALATFTPGSRMEQVSLTLKVRTSRGTTEQLIVPQDAQLASVKVNGTARPARLHQGKLELHLDPGSHVIELSLQRPRGIELFYQPMRIASARPLANVNTELRIPEGRWLLWARGPAWGPAVLFWGYLIVVLLAAIGLGRIAISPLKTHQWILLGLGLTQVEAPVALLIVGWLFALAYREKHQVEGRLLFNATQVLLVGLSIVALACLGYAVHRGLVVQPSMQVEGMGSTDQLLRWYADRTGGAFPDVSIWSAPLWVYKALMLLWALWLAAAVIRWLRWGFVALRTGGGYRPGRPDGDKTNPRVNLADIEAAEAELKRNQTGAPPDGNVGPEGAGAP